MKKWRYLPELVDYIGLPFQNGNGYGTGAIGVTTPESFTGGGRGTGFWGDFDSGGSGCGHGDINGGGSGPRYYATSGWVREVDSE